MASKSSRRRKQPTVPRATVPRATATPAEGDAPSESRAMHLAKQGGVVVGLVSGVIGLVFLLFPQLRPERKEPPADQSASISGMVVNPHTTRGQFLDYLGRSKRGLTKEQLAVVGSSAFARVQIAGYRGRTLTLERQLIDTQTGNLVGQARDFLVTPPAEKVTHRWGDWAPLPSRRGSFIFVIKLLDDKQHAEVACGQSEPFSGAGGPLAAKTIHICEGP